MLFVIAVALMVAIQPEAYRNVAILMVPSFYRRRARVILSQCGEALSSWMIGVLISSLCVAVLAGVVVRPVAHPGVGLAVRAGCR